MTRVPLTKLHGLGNDFLVAVEPPAPVGPGLARRVCHRRTGVGADGLLVAHPGVRSADADLSMTLWNADGTEAEMSGNGIRCLVHAAVRRGAAVAAEVGSEVTVATAAGLRRVRIDELDGATVVTTADMGVPAEGPAPVLEGPEAQKVASVDVGNPHLVRLVAGAEAAAADLAGFSAPDRNVERVWLGPEPGSISLRVVERGVGETQACGTGAVAAAWAAQAWGLVGPTVAVHMPGGIAVVEVDPDGAARLRGPSTWVADLEIEVGR